ncbi:MAG: hypothetical protein ACFFDY_08070 [Candidatus Thorarchaeota archaeon]
MGTEEEFMKKVYEIITELELPLIDERVQEKVNLKSSNAITTIKFIFEQDEAIIRGFLGLAEYFHTVVIKQKNYFYIPHDHKLFILESK